MKRRRNADDALRKAERAFQQDRTEGNKIRYWIESLRADKLPDGTPYSNHADWKTKEWVVRWFWPARKGEAHQAAWYSLDHGFLLENRIIGTRKEVLDEVKKWLKELLNKRENPDDNLRALERRAAQGDPNDVLAYWQACVRAGKIPPAPGKCTDKMCNNSCELLAWSIQDKWGWVSSVWVPDAGWARSGKYLVHFYKSGADKPKVLTARTRPERHKAILKQLQRYIDAQS